MLVGCILGTVPFVALALLYFGIFGWKGRQRNVALAIAILGLGAWLPLRHFYFVSRWSAHEELNTTVGQSVYSALGYWGKIYEDELSNLFLMDKGLSHALRSHDNEYVRYRSAIMLGLRSHLEDQSALVDGLDDASFYVRLICAIALWKHNAPDVTYTLITEHPTKSSLADYMGRTELPSVPYGDEHKEIWAAFIEQIRQDFGGGV